MKTGARFWQLIGLVFLILAGYVLAELNDAVVARQKQLQDQEQLLYKQEDLLRNLQWDKNLASIDKVRQQWLSYLPVENSPAVAKAHLISELRSSAVNAGITNATVNATDSEGAEQANPASVGTGNSSSAGRTARGDAKSNSLPSGIHVIKANITGRFDPAAFTKLLRVLEEERRFTVIERVNIRGTQMDLSIRCYWRADAAARGTATAGANALPVTAKP